MILKNAKNGIFFALVINKVKSNIDNSFIFFSMIRLKYGFCILASIHTPKNLAKKNVKSLGNTKRS